MLCVPRDLWIWRREPGETKVAYSLGQVDSPRHKVLEERCLVEKKESAAGDLGAGSFPLDKKGCLVPGVEEGTNGGLGDGCLRWLLFQGFADQVLEKDSGSVF